MNIKLFGKSIFEFNKHRVDHIVNNAVENLQKSKFLPDFVSMREYEFSFGDIVGVDIKKEEDKKIIKKQLTPKEVYKLKLINNDNFEINTNIDYINDQLNQFKDKLNIIKSTEFDVSRGVNEISSIIIRLENRKKYSEFKEFFDNYAYTTTSKINEVISKHDYLKLGKIQQFIADMPKEAVEEMKKYTEYTEKISNKKPIFYIIANKDDFQKTEQRKDPILLAQSPFGHFWQIIGAWDEEMLLLEEL